MKVVVTTTSYDGIPRVVTIVITGPEIDEVGYCMAPDTWKQIEPVYSGKLDCIMEYRWRDATEVQYEQVQEILRQMEQRS